MNEPGQDVAAEVIGAEQVLCSPSLLPHRRLELIIKGVLDRVVGADEGCKYGGRRKEGDDDEPCEACLVLEKLFDLVKERMPVLRIPHPGPEGSRC